MNYLFKPVFAATLLLIFCGAIDSLFCMLSNCNHMLLITIIFIYIIYNADVQLGWKCRPAVLFLNNIFKIAENRVYHIAALHATLLPVLEKMCSILLLPRGSESRLTKSLLSFFSKLHIRCFTYCDLSKIKRHSIHCTYSI